MRGPRPEPRRCRTTRAARRPRALAATLAALLAGCAAPLVGKGEKGTAGERWLLSVDNDSYNFDDGNYTNGTEVLWVSAPVDAHPEGSLPPRIVARLRGLPGLGGADARHHVSLGLTHLIFTPEEIFRRYPGPDERPYAGVLVFDGSVLAVEEDRVTGWSLRLGVIGQGSLAEEIQKEVHPWFGAEDPDGWDEQIRDEPVVNVGWVHRRRVLAGRVGDLVEWDATPRAGAHLGTFLTGVEGGVQVRFGPDLADGMPALPPRTGFETHPLLGTPSGPGSAWYGFWDASGHAVAHYLPIDGAVFRDSRSTDGEPLVGQTSLGIALGRGPLVLTVAYTLLTDAYETQRNSGQFGTISLSWER